MSNRQTPTDPPLQQQPRETWNLPSFDAWQTGCAAVTGEREKLAACVWHPQVAELPRATVGGPWALPAVVQSRLGTKPLGFKSSLCLALDSAHLAHLSDGEKDVTFQGCWKNESFDVRKAELWLLRSKDWSV